MSNFIRPTKHPLTDKIEDAEWVEDYHGLHYYGVRFPSDGRVYIEDVCKEVDE